jgi:hypothetical protein
MRMSTAKRIREHIRGYPRKHFSPAEVARALRISREKVQDALKDFLRRGEIGRIGQGRYLYKGSEMLNKRPATINPRIYRAMYAQTIFSAREVSVLADAKKNTVHKAMKRLRKAGEIVKAGRRKSPRGDIENTYRLGDRDAFLLQYIEVRRERGA